MKIEYQTPEAEVVTLLKDICTLSNEVVRDPDDNNWLPDV